MVTRTMSKAEPGLSDGDLGDNDFEAPSLSVSQSELLQEQICDSSLN